MILSAIFLIFIGILGVIIFILYSALKDSKKENTEYKSLIESVRYNNKELRKALQRKEIIENEKKDKITKIKNTNKDNIVNMLNDELSND
jgi:hypothetical protein